MTKSGEGRKGGLSLAAKVVLLNLFIIVLVFGSALSNTLAVAGSALLFAFLLIRALQNPEETFFIAFGIKLTYDTLWNIKILQLPAVGAVGPLDLFIVVILALALFGPRGAKGGTNRIYLLPAIYLVWVAAATAFNGEPLQPEALLRQAGMVFGIALGITYVRTLEDFEKLMLMIFLSALFPLLASSVDAVLGPQGISIFHYKVSTLRGVRTSGLYYDSATSGMMAILFIYTNLYLLNRKALSSRLRKLQVLLLPLALLVILAGGTRSVTVVVLTGMMLLMAKGRRTAVYIIPIVLVTVYLAHPYIDRMLARTQYETREPIRIGSVLEDKQYRGLFTGRGSIWQEIWKDFNEGSDLQVLFGHGRTSNAHSTYFYLLLQIGWLGLLFFLLLQFFFLRLAWAARTDPLPKNFALILHGSFLLISFSMTAVIYTTFQWTVFLILAAVVSGLAAVPSREQTKKALEEGIAAGFLLPEDEPPGEADAGAAAAAAIAAPVPVPVAPQAAGGGAGAGEPPLRTRPEAFEFFATSSRWFALAAVPAVLIAVIWAWGQKAAERRQAEENAAVSASIQRHRPLSGAVGRPVLEPLRAAPVAPPAFETPPLPPPVEVPAPVAEAPAAKMVPPPVAEPVASSAPPPPPWPPAAAEEEPVAGTPLPAPLKPLKPLKRPKPVIEEPVFDVTAALAEAEALAKGGALAEAVAAYKKIAVADPRAWQAYIALADMAMDRGEFEEATKYYRLAETFIRIAE